MRFLATVFTVMMVLDINRVRVENGLDPLVETEQLDSVALYRSDDMVTRKYFSHVTPDCHNVLDIIDERGIGHTYWGENIAWNYASQDAASSMAFQGFMNSPNHRAAILNPNFTMVGVGESRNEAEGWNMIAVVFLTP